MRDAFARVAEKYMTHFITAPGSDGSGKGHANAENADFGTTATVANGFPHSPRHPHDGLGIAENDGMCLRWDMSLRYLLPVSLFFASTTMFSQDVIYDEEKVPSYDLPDPLRFENGQPVTSPEEWKERRAELLAAPGYVDQALQKGAAAARKIVAEVTARARAAVGI